MLDDANPEPLERAFAASIGGAAPQMISPIHLDGEAEFAAEEIGDEALSQRHLATKADTEFPSGEPFAPKQLLGRSRSGAHEASPRFEERVAFRRRKTT